MKYDKPHLSIDTLLSLIESRGLEVGDRTRAIQDLESIGYYRLSGYWYQWRERAQGHREDRDTPGDRFVGNHTFDEAAALYAFDRRLRLILMDAIERVEVAIRVRIAHVVGERGALAYLDHQSHGPFGRAQRDAFSPTNTDWFVRRNRDLIDASSERFARHMREKYDGIPPIWIAVELWDFGLLSHFYQLMLLEDQIVVANAFRIPLYSMLVSWLKSLAYLRNICAHHGRLYRRTLVVKPDKKEMRRIPELRHIRTLNTQRQDKLYPDICVLAFLMRSIAPQSGWLNALLSHLSAMPSIAGSSLADYGFPDTWAMESLWQNTDT